MSLIVFHIHCLHQQFFAHEENRPTGSSQIPSLHPKCQPPNLTHQLGTDTRPGVLFPPVNQSHHPPGTPDHQSNRHAYISSWPTWAHLTRLEVQIGVQKFWSPKHPSRIRISGFGFGGFGQTIFSRTVLCKPLVKATMAHFLFLERNSLNDIAMCVSLYASLTLRKNILHAGNNLQI